MDIVEINKRTQRKYTDPALDHLFELSNLTKDDSLTLVLFYLSRNTFLKQTIQVLNYRLLLN